MFESVDLTPQSPLNPTEPVLWSGLEGDLKAREAMHSLPSLKMRILGNPPPPRYFQFLRETDAQEILMPL